MIETLICAGEESSGFRVRPGLLIDLHCVSGVFGGHDGVYVGETDRPARLRYCRHRAAFVLSYDCSRRCLVSAGQGAFCVPAPFELSHHRLQPFAFSLNVEPRHSHGCQSFFWIHLLIFVTVLLRPRFLWLSVRRCGYQFP